MVSLIWREVAILWQRRSVTTLLGSLKSRAGVTKPSRKFSTIQWPFNNLYYGIDSPEIPKLGECLTVGRLTRLPLNQDKSKVSYYFHSNPTVKWHKLARFISKGYNLAWWLDLSLLSHWVPSIQFVQDKINFHYLTVNKVNSYPKNRLNCHYWRYEKSLRLIDLVHWKIMKTVLPNSSLAFIPPSSFMYSKTRDDFRSLLLVPVVASGSLVWHEVLTVSYETGRNRSVRYISLWFFHLFIMAGAHDEEKQETRESIYCNKCSTRKLGTSKKRSTQSARSPQSAVCMVCISTWPWTGY